MSVPVAVGAVVGLVVLGVGAWVWGKFLYDHDVIYAPQLKNDPKLKRKLLIFGSVFTVVCAVAGFLAALGTHG